MLGFLSVIVLSFYLYGKVQINFLLQENEDLKREKQKLQSELGGLRIQVNTMKRYERIVEEAEKIDMVVLSASQLEKLPVDVKGLERESEDKEYSLRYAGFATFGKAKKNN